MKDKRKILKAEKMKIKVTIDEIQLVGQVRNRRHDRYIKQVATINTHGV